MGLRTKILFGFLVLAVMLIVAGIWSVYEFRTVGTSVQKLLDENYRSINSAKGMILALEREDSGVLIILSGKSEDGRAILESADEAFVDAYEVAKSNVTIPGEEECVRRVDELYSRFKALWTEVLTASRKDRDLGWYFREAHTAFLDVRGAVEELMGLNSRTMYEAASELKSRAQRAVMPGIVAVISALLFVLVFNYLINYYVVGPIVGITEGIRRYLKTGEQFDIRIETRDELFQLSNSIKELLSQFGRGGTSS